METKGKGGPLPGLTRFPEVNKNVAVGEAKLRILDIGQLTWNNSWPLVLLSLTPYSSNQFVVTLARPSHLLKPAVLMDSCILAKLDLLAHI